MKELIESWVKATELSKNNPGRGSDNWAIQKVLDMHLEGEHEEIWKIILGITEATDSEWVLECLGAGPLEDLLNSNASVYIERIEKQARVSPRFKKALSAVWLDKNDTPLYKRVYKAAGVEPPFD